MIEDLMQTEKMTFLINKDTLILIELIVFYSAKFTQYGLCANAIGGNIRILGCCNASIHGVPNEPY